MDILYIQLSSYHPRRRNGSQLGEEKRRVEGFQAWEKERLGKGSERNISRWSSECWLLIGHKECFVLLCPIGEQHLLSSLIFVCLYTMAIVLP